MFYLFSKIFSIVDFLPITDNNNWKTIFQLNINFPGIQFVVLSYVVCMETTAAMGHYHLNDYFVI